MKAAGLLQSWSARHVCWVDSISWHGFKETGVKREGTADPLRGAKSSSSNWKRARGMLCRREIMLCCWAFTFKREPARALITTCDETLEQRRTAAENNSVGNLYELELQVKSSSSSHTQTQTYTSFFAPTARPCSDTPLTITGKHRGGLSLPLRPGW